MTDGLDVNGLEMEGTYVKKENLLSTKPIPLSKIILRVRNNVLDIYLLTRKNPKGIRAVCKVRDLK